jgi:hypothetical protein
MADRAGDHIHQHLARARIANDDIDQVDGCPFFQETTPRTV